jgi:hypothetical protein
MVATKVIDRDCGELEARVRGFLGRHPFPVLRRLHVEMDGDAAILQGIVGSYYERQVAIECCKRVAGVRRVVDQIRVDAPTPIPPPYQR